MKPLRYRTADRAAYGLMFLFLAADVALRILL